MSATGNGTQNERDVSLCTQRRAAPAALHWATVDSGTVQAEMVQEVYDAPPAKGARDAARIRHLRNDLISEIRARLRSAAKGMLPLDPDLFEPVRRDPELWEHKWKKTKLGEFRLYHAEPKSGPDVVLLRFHRKETAERDGLSVGDLQDAAMDQASERYATGADSAWGHPTRRCTSCENT